jgi:hypothetical protein
VHFFTAPHDGFTFLSETLLSKPEFHRLATMRKYRLADLGDRDVYGAQQHAPLLDLEL